MEDSKIGWIVWANCLHLMVPTSQRFYCPLILVILRESADHMPSPSILLPHWGRESKIDWIVQEFIFTSTWWWTAFVLSETCLVFYNKLLRECKFIPLWAEHVLTRILSYLFGPYCTHPHLNKFIALLREIFSWIPHAFILLTMPVLRTSNCIPPAWGCKNSKFWAQ